MKKILLLTMFSFLLSSCDLDNSFDDVSKVDRDDFNIIKKNWDQWLDKALKLYDTKSHAS